MPDLDGRTVAQLQRIRVPVPRSLARCTKTELFVVLLSALFGAFTKSWSDIHCHPDTRNTV